MKIKTLQETKIGEQVLVFCRVTSSSIILLADNSKTGYCCIPATVLDYDILNGEVVLGWKDNEIIPSMTLTSIYNLSATQISSGFSICQVYGDHCKCISLEEEVTKPIIKELPCRGCQRLNYTDVKVCYLCGLENPF